LTVLNWHKSKKFSIKGYEIEVEAIPAIHGVNPLSALFAGKVNGYYLTISKGKETVSVYITGDTVYKNKVVNSLNGKEIDLLIPNMGAAKEGSWIMTLTLNAKMLKKMIAKLNPTTVIPVHYGTFEHYKEPLEKIMNIKDDRIKIVKIGESVIVN
jgi:N-acyl-phosphatidylethanolamine-hydrolysing phospholipase D